jgi:rhodanese-related sulfurtransferase
MNRFISYRKTVFFVFTFIFSFQFLNAQDIDTVKSDYVYSVLSSNNFNERIIDGRDSTMFYSGHIKNAVFIDAFSQDLNKSLQKYLTKDTLIIYCTNNRRSEIIIENLKLLNYKGLIIYMQDGLNGWKENEFDIVIPLNNMKK